MHAKRLILCIALILIGPAGIAAAQGTGTNPAEIQQLVIPSTPARVSQSREIPADPATIAALNRELQIAQAFDEAFATALLDALLNDLITPTDSPLVFIPKPSVVRTYSLSTPSTDTFAETTQTLPLRPPLVRPPYRRRVAMHRTQTVEAPRPVAQPRPTPPAPKVPTSVACQGNVLSLTTACSVQLDHLASAPSSEIVTLDDGVYVKN